MKGKFDAYVLWPLAKKFQIWIVDRSTTPDFTVYESMYMIMYDILRNTQVHALKVEIQGGGFHQHLIKLC